ncbi:MAG: D-glycerate dehydrogenase [Polyangiaceae bacterium]
MPTDQRVAKKLPVLVCGPLHADALARLREACDVTIATGPAKETISPERFEALVTLLTTNVDEELLARFSALRLVSTVSVGVDHIDLAACARHGARVAHTPDVLTDATADLAMGLIVAASRRMGEAERFLRAKGFPVWSPSFMLGKSLRGKTLGIVGYGRIGRAVATRARGFGMHVVAAAHGDAAPDDDVPRVPFRDLLGASDVVSLHVPLRPSTRHLVGERELRSMRPGSILVNTSRGAVVDEDALVSALRDGHLFAAGLDVYEHEPRVHEGLLSLENVVLLPHIGSADDDTRRAMAMLAADNVVAFATTGTLLTQVKIPSNSDSLPR